MWWWESVAWGSTNALVWGTCAHVGGDPRGCSWGSQMAQTCGNWVIKLPGALTTTMGQLCGDHVIPEAHSSWDWHILCSCSSEATHVCGDRVVPAHWQWCKLGETEPEPGCQMGVCLAAHTVAHSRQPPPPTDFSLQLKDDV